MVLRQTPPLLPLLLLLWVAASVTTGAILNDFIRHYEPVEYDASQLHAQHRRVRRSTEPSPDVRLRFHASNRDFRLRLRPDRAVFSPDVVFESDSGPVQFDTNSVYTGVLEDDENAVVHGVISSDGLFDGSVATSSEHYYIEPAQRYFPQQQQPFHSLVYRLSDVIQPAQAGRGCASHSLAQRNRTGADVRVTSDGEVDEWLGHEQLYENLTESAAEAVGGGGGGETGERRRRAIVNNKKNTCTMYLQADHLFYDQFGSEEACIEAMIRHVQQANEIYKGIDFDSDGVRDNIGFMIKRVRVHKPSAVNDVGYRFPGNYGVDKYLEKFSEENYDSFCLAYMFTYRDFEGGTLGLAWTGDLNQAGGVCEKNGYYRGSKKSLNSGIISILNYGKRVPPAVSHVTFAHEVGHNFGSQHDPEKDKACTPGGVDGNYIMYARATSGDKRNNNRFSPCSLRSINPVLKVKARSTHGCFVEPQAAICGNGVVEDGEECDCGWEEDCVEACCNPMSVTPPTGRPPCQLRAGARCSPSQGPCCNDTCEFGYGQECRDDNGCRGKARCNGRSSECPPSIRKPDRTICNEGNVCFKGECSGSICLAYGLESCQCEPEAGGNNTKSCELCCKRPGIDQPCISSYEWNSDPFKIPDLFSKPGTPCNQYTGYCDVFQMCREVDPIGPLATLKNLFLSDKSLSVVKEFMDRYWYMIVLCLVIIILSLIAVIRIFGKAPPKYHRRHRRRPSGTKKRPPDGDVENPPLPDVTAGAEAAPVAEPADTEQTASERGRPQLKRRVDDVRRAAAKARRAASHMALSSRASVASGVARVTQRGKRDSSRPSGGEQRKRRRKDQSKSRGRRQPREQSKDAVKVISYSNIPADLGVTETKTEPRLTGSTARSAEAPAVADVDKRKSLPAAVARRKPTASADAEKRRSLPKPPGSPQKPARHESPSKQRRSTAEVPAAREPGRERGRRKTKDAEQDMKRSSSQRQRSSKREEKKRSRSISPTKRPARDSRQTAKPADDSADKKKRFGLKQVKSADNVISDWLGRNAKKEAQKHKQAERNRKKPIVPTAPMHPNDQVLQWLRSASSEPSGVDVADGMASPKPTRRLSLSSSEQTSGSLQRTASRPGFGRVTSCEESSLSSRRQQSASPAPRDAGSSLGAASRRRGASQSELSGGSAARPAYHRSRSQPAPTEERLSFQAVPEAVYDLPRGTSPERIYDLPSSATPERELPAEPPRPAEPTRPPPDMDRQLSMPAFQQPRPPRSGSPSRRPPQRNVSVPAALHSRSPGRPDRTSAPPGPQNTRRTASPSRHSSSERPGSVPSSRRPNSTVSHHSPDRPLPSPPTERQGAALNELQVAAPAEDAADTPEESFLAMRADR